MHYKFCPQCGSKLIDKEAGDDGLVPFCTDCNKYWFDTFASCVIIMVINEYNEIALLKQGYISNEYWTFVAGYIKPGENAEDTALREVEEEIGIKLEKLEYEGTHWFERGDQLMHAYFGYAKKKEFELSIEVDDAMWASIEDAPKYMFPNTPRNTQYILFNKYKQNKKCL